jgi:cytochrome oxidase Cu insertion factor (SCO1/SenC/PrrC family)
MNSSQKKDPPAKRRVFLLIFFLVPSLLCLLFYYFGIRKPFTEGGKIFKPLPHLGKFKGISADGDSLFEAIPDFHFTDAKGNVLDKTNMGRKFYLLTFIDDTCTQDCKAVLFQLSRAQEKLHYLRKSFQMITVVHGEEGSRKKKLEEIELAVHPDPEIWKTALSETPLPLFVLKELRVGMLPKLARCKHQVPSEWAILIDMEHQTRAYYRIIDVKETDRMITEALVLSAEYGKFKNMNLNQP